MKTLIATLVLLSISISCFAEITIDDLPYLEGTPLLDRVDDLPVWSVLDYAEEDGVVQWAWLDNAGYAAYVVYPADDETLLPDNSWVPASDHMLTLRFVGDNQEYSFSRHDSEIVVSGDEITFGYTAPDKLYLFDDQSPDGDLSIKAEYIQIGRLVGDFRLVTLDVNVSGADILVIGDGSNFGNEISESPGIGSSICPGSSVTISSDPYRLEPGSTCLNGSIISAPITLPDLSHVVINLCRLPEPHEYTGEKKVLCGENWVELSDKEWADLTANIDLQPIAEAPQEQNPPKNKKSKGGSVSFSMLQLLLLLLFVQLSCIRVID